MTAADVAALLGVVLAAVLGGGGVVGWLTLREQKAKASAEAAKTLADAEHADASTDAVVGAVYQALIKELRAELGRLKGELGEIREEMSHSAAREWHCLANQEKLRRSLIEHGIPVPELTEARPLYDPATRQHPLRRRTDYLPNEGDTP